MQVKATVLENSHKYLLPVGPVFKCVLNCLYSTNNRKSSFSVSQMRSESLRGHISATLLYDPRYCTHDV